MGLILVLLSFLSLSNSWAAPSYFEQRQMENVFGTPLGADYHAGSRSDQAELFQSEALLNVFGTSVQVMQSQVNPPMSVEGVSYTEVSSFDLQVLADSFYLEAQSPFELSWGLAPIEVRVPVAVYPLGPLVLLIEGGARFLGEFQEQVQPTIMFPASLSQLGLRLQMSTRASAFFEGYADLLAVRGGLEGSLDLLTAHTDWQAEYSFDGRTPELRQGVVASFFEGELYSFFDLFDLFSWGWTRTWTMVLFRWNGSCVSEGDLSCSTP